jgi:hypothetical protein
VDVSAWYTVEFDTEHIRLCSRAPGNEPWEADLRWADIVRVCFQAEDLYLSDGLYIFTRQRPESYPIPIEAFGGQELWAEIIRRGLFDARLAIRAAMASEGLFCWPPEPEEGTPAQEGRMEKKAFLRWVRDTRADFDAAVGQVEPERMSQPGVSGVMSVKDILAHVTWFEREMVGLLRQEALVGSELWELPEDERNAAILEANRDRPLGEVLEEAPQVFQQLLQALEALDEGALNDASRFRGMPADWVPWQVIAGSSSRHYEDHGADIQAWLQKQRG